jgi:hypothetical protein
LNNNGEYLLQAMWKEARDHGDMHQVWQGDTLWLPQVRDLFRYYAAYQLPRLNIRCIWQIWMIILGSNKVTEEDFEGR